VSTRQTPVSTDVSSTQRARILDAGTEAAANSASKAHLYTVSLARTALQISPERS
jgi:hypothetical protein